MLRRQCLRERLHLGSRRVNVTSRLEASHCRYSANVRKLTRSGRVQIVHRKWHIHLDGFGNQIVECKLWIQYSQDSGRTAIQDDLLSNDLWICVEVAAPQAMAEHDNPILSRKIFAIHKCSAQGRTDPEDIKEGCFDPRRENARRLQ